MDLKRPAFPVVTQDARACLANRYRVFGGPKMVAEQIEKSEEDWRKLEKGLMLILV